MTITPTAERVRRALLGLALSVGLAGPAMAQTAAVYVANALDDTVSVLQENATYTVAVGDNPQGIAVSPDGARVYTANAASDTISVINTLTRQVVHTIHLSPGSQPYSVAVSRNGQALYVANYGGHNVEAYGTASLAKLYTTAAIQTPIQITVSPTSNLIYVASFANQTVEVRNGDTGASVQSLTAGLSTYHTAISRDGAKGYIAAPGANQLYTLNPATGAMALTTISPGAHATEFSSDGSKLYALEWGGGYTSVIDTTNNTVTGNITVGSSPHSLAISANGAHLYVANYGNHGVQAPGSLSVIDTATDTVVRTITVGANPASVAVFGSPNLASPPPPAAIPTLTEWAMILLGLALAGFATLTLQRRRQTV